MSPRSTITAPQVEDPEVVEKRRYSKKVNVTEKDIEKGVKNNSSRCAVARALARAFPWATAIQADLQTLRLTDKETGKRVVFLTAPRAAAHIVAFDAGDELQPISFRLKPSQIIEYQTRQTTFNKDDRRVPRRPKQRNRTIRKDGVVTGGEPIRANRGRRHYGARHLRINMLGKVEGVVGHGAKAS